MLKNQGVSQSLVSVWEKSGYFVTPGKASKEQTTKGKLTQGCETTSKFNHQQSKVGARGGRESRRVVRPILSSTSPNGHILRYGVNTMRARYWILYF